MQLTLADVAQCLSGMAEEGYESVTVNSVQTDSRMVSTGDLFFCIEGENFDGHEFAASVAKAGAAGIVASRMIDDVDVPVVMVRNTTEALGRLAACWRDMCGARLVAVTGTAGKTTVKEMLYAVASQKFDTAKNYRNFNNQIGLPMSMLKASADQELWIMELGISRQGDMEELAPVASPDVAVITNIGPGHLEGLGNEAGVAQAKTVLLKYLRQSGTAIVCKDYPLLWNAAREIVNSPIGFSTCATTQIDRKCASARRKENSGPPRSSSTQESEFPATTQQSCACDQSDTSYVASFLGGGETEGWGLFRLKTPEGDGEFTAPFCGEHYAENLACVAAAAHALGLSREDVIKGVQTLVPDTQRFCCRPTGGTLVIDDTYNANPLSTTRSIRTAKEMAGDRPLVLVLGEMRELGSEAAMRHEELGELAREMKPEALFFRGGHSEDVARGFGGTVHEVTTADAFMEAWRELDIRNSVVLVKGSRSLKMEEISGALCKALGDTAGFEGDCK